MGYEYSFSYMYIIGYRYEYDQDIYLENEVQMNITTLYHL